MHFYLFHFLIAEIQFNFINIITLSFIFFKNIKIRYSDVATDEVSHLFAAADNDHDDRLSIDEIVDNHDLFVGSEATDYGDHLQNIDNLRDEL